MTDKERIDHLERMVNRYGAILLHDGNSNPHHHIGIGLRPGILVRTLREAIDQSGAVPAPAPAAEAHKEVL